MPDVTLTLAAEDQASGILDRIVNSVEDLTHAVNDQVGVYSEFQQEILRKQEAANKAVMDRVDNEKKVFDTIKEVLDKTERLYRQHAETMEVINEKMRIDRGTIEDKKEFQRQTTDDKMRVKQLEDTVKRESDIRKSGLEDKKDQFDENKQARRMAFQDQVTSDKARLSQMGNTNRRETGMRDDLKKNQEHLITDEGHVRRMEFQRQVERDKRSLKRLTHKNKEEDAKTKRGLENRKNTIDKERHLRRTEYQDQITSDRKELKQLDETVKEKDHTRRKDLENIRQQGKTEIQILRNQQRERDRLFGKMRGGRGRGGIGGASEVFKGILYADLFGVGVQEIRALGSEILQATIKIQGMIFGLQAVEGSAEKAAIQLDRIVDIAKLPGIQLEPAIKAVVTLRALKLEGELVERTIKAIGNALATLGREGELGGVVLALSQIVGKGKIHAEEINQIAERLPLIRGILVEEFGTANTEVLQKMELEIEDFVERITRGLERLPKVATQIGTSFKNLENQIFLFTAQIGTFFKEDMMGAINWITDRLESANAALKFMNKRSDDLAKQHKVIGEAQAITVKTDLATGVSAEMSRQSQRVQDIYNALDNLEQNNPTRTELAREEYYKDIGAETGFQRMVSDFLTGSYMKQFEQMEKPTEPERQQLLEALSEEERKMSELTKSQKEAADALGKLSYEDLKKHTLALDTAIRERTRLLGLGDEGRMEEFRRESAKAREDVDQLPVNPMYKGIALDVANKELAEKYILAPDQIQDMKTEMDGWRRALVTLGERSTEILANYRKNLKETAENAAKAAEVKLQIYNEKIAKLVSAEIVPELSPSLENKIRRVAESTDVQIGIEAKVLGLQEQFNNAVDVGLDGLLRSVDEQFERDMAKIARNIKPIAEGLRPEIAALKTKAEREAEHDKVLANIRKQMEAVTELHKQTITEYYNSLVALEVTFKEWLSDTRGAVQLPTQMLTRIDKLAESNLIQDAIGLQLEGLSEPFNRVREYAIGTLTRTIEQDTVKRLDKLREDVLKIAKATHHDFHTFSPERQIEIFNELFEQRAPAIRASEKVLIDVTADRFNAILDIHLEFQQWYQETVGKDTIAPQLENIVRQVTQRSDFDEAIKFRAEGFEQEFQYERTRLLSRITRKLEEDASKAVKDAAQQAGKALVMTQGFLDMTTEQRVAEWEKIFKQLSAPIQPGLEADIRDTTEHLDKIIEVRTTINKWIRDNFKDSFLSDQQLSMLRRAISSKEFQAGVEFQVGGMTHQFATIKEHVLGNLIDSINSDAEDRIRKAARDIEDIVLADPANLNKSKMDLLDTIQETHEKRVDVIVASRDLAIQELKDEFERLSQIEVFLRRSASERLVGELGQTRLHRLVTEDIEKTIGSAELQKAFEQRVKGIISPVEFRDVMDEGLEKLIKGYQRDTVIAIEKMYEQGPGILAPRIAQIDSAIEQQKIIDAHYKSEEARIRGRETRRTDIARSIYGREVGREAEEQRENKLIDDVKKITTSQRFDRLDVNKEFRDKETQMQQAVEDSALTAANNVINAWQQVSAQTDTMVDDVIGAVATIALQVTEMLLTIQRTAAAASIAGQTQTGLGQFAQGLGIAGIALGAAATVYSFVDNRDDSRKTRNNISRPRPKTISHR